MQCAYPEPTMADDAVNLSEQGLSELLREIRQGSPDWQEGDALHRLRVSDQQLQRLGRLVVLALKRGLSTLSIPQRQSWGAAMMLVGARTFQALGGSRCTYADLWQSLQAPQFGIKSPFRNAEYDLIEQGSIRHWRLQIQRRGWGEGSTRLFQTTMVLQSGADWGVLLAVCPLVDRFWSWESLLLSPPSVIEHWLNIQRHRLAHQPCEFLSEEERRLATAERLMMVAKGRDLLLDKALVAPTYEETQARLDAFGLTLTTLFDAPTEKGASDLLKCLFPSSKERPAQILGRPRLYWDFAKRRLCLELPRSLYVADVPITVQRLRLVVPVISHGAIEYHREGGYFTREQSAGLPLPEGVTWPVEVYAAYECNKILQEKWACTLPFPGTDIALFGGPEGYVLHRPIAHEQLVLIGAPGLRLIACPEGIRTLQQGLHVWRGSLPPGTSHLTLTNSEGEQLERTLETTYPPLLVEAVGSEIGGLRFKTARGSMVQGFLRWPGLCLQPPLNSGEYELETPDGTTIRGRFSVFGNRLRLDLTREYTAPGIYHIRFSQGKHQGSLQFALLPTITHFSVNSNADGTHVQAQGAILRWKEGSSRDTLRLPPTVRGCVKVEVILPGVSSLPTGQWEVIAAPALVELADLDDNVSIPLHHDLRRLRKGGGMRVYGPQGATITRTLKRGTITREYQSLIPASGVRFLPWNELDPAFKELGAGTLKVDVAIEAAGRRILEQPLGPFHDCTTQAPKVRSAQERGKTVLQLSFPWSAFDEPSVALIPMDRPWETPKINPCIAKDIVTPGSEPARLYEATLPEPPPPAYVVLLDGHERFSAIALTSQSHLPQAPKWKKLLQPTSSPHSKQLFQNLSQFGTAWLPGLSTGLINHGAMLRLAALLLERSELQDVLKIFHEAGVSPLAVRYTDLDTFVERELLDDIRTSPRKCLEALEALGDNALGLIVRAGQRIFAHSEGNSELIAGCLQRLSHWSTLVQQAPESLSDEDIEALKTPGTLGVTVREPTGPWARALLQTQQRLSRLPEAERDALLAVADGSTPHERLTFPLAWSWRNAGLERLCPVLRSIDSEVLTQSGKLHHWREHAPVGIEWRELDRLSRKYPELMDYWLNRWSVLLPENVSQLHP